MRFNPAGMTQAEINAKINAYNDRYQTQVNKYGGSAPQTAYGISDFGYEPDLPQKPDLPAAFNDPSVQEPTYPYNPYGPGGGRPQRPPLFSGIPGVGLLAPEEAQSATGVSDLGYEPDLPTETGTTGRYVSSPEIDPYTQAYTNPYSSPLTTQVSGMEGSFGTGAMPYTQPYYQRSFNPYSGGFGMGQPMRGGGYGGKGGGSPYGGSYGRSNPYSSGYGMGFRQQPSTSPMGGGKGGGMPAYGGGYGGYGGYGGKGGRR